MLELGSMPLKVGECLLLGAEGRRKSAHLPARAEREEESDGSVLQFDSAHDLHSPKWNRRSNDCEDAEDGYRAVFLERFLAACAGNAA